MQTKYLNPKSYSIRTYSHRKAFPRLFYCLRNRYNIPRAMLIYSTSISNIVCRAQATIQLKWWACRTTDEKRRFFFLFDFHICLLIIIIVGKDLYGKIGHEQEHFFLVRESYAHDSIRHNIGRRNNARGRVKEREQWLLMKMIDVISVVFHKWWLGTAQMPSRYYEALGILIVSKSIIC